MSKMGQELDKRLDEVKYDMYEICEYLAKNGWNAQVSEDAQKVIAKVEGK